MNFSIKFIFIIPCFYSIVFSQDFSLIDKDFSELNFNKTIIPLEQLNDLYPNSTDILLRLSIAHHYLSEQAKQKKEDKENAQKAFKYIQQAYDLNSENSEVLKWYVIALGKTVEEESIRKQIEQSKNIEKLSLKVIDLLPNDEFCYNIMGQWHYKLASLSKASRRIASFLFSEPPIGSFIKAKFYLEQSIKINPNYIGTYYWLGKTYIALGNPKKAKELFEIVILLESPFKREEEIYRKINSLIKI